MVSSLWFDAHVDLAYLAECGRDMTQPPRPDMDPHPPAAVTLASLVEGGFAACLGTVFTEAFEPGQDPKYPTTAYPAGDAEAAHRAGVRQLGHYHSWRDRGLIDLLSRDSLRKPAAPIVLGILVEGADPIRSPEELAWWKGQGVVAVGLAWWKASRYAGGNGTDLGLSDLGRALVPAMDELGIVHDLSHLSQRATDDLLALTDAPVIASHSNCRALVAGENQRHLADATIREIARRGGVIGLNLCSPFLVSSGADGERATIADCVRHVEHVCEVAGNRVCVGLGSDMDGGFSALKLPEGIERPADCDRIARALLAAGWSEAEAAGFRYGNWLRFWASRL